MINFKIDGIDKFLLADDLCLADGVCTPNADYFTTNKKIIVVSSYNESNYIRTDKIYNKITYDARENCLFATSKEFESFIFKLNLSLTEVSAIDLCFAPSYKVEIYSIDYDQKHDSIILNINSKLFEINKETFCITDRCHHLDSNPFTIHSTNNYLIGLSSNAQNYSLNIFQDCKLISVYPLPTALKYKGIICSNECDNSITLNLLAADSNYCQYVLTLTINLTCNNANNPCSKSKSCSLRKLDSCNDVVQSLTLIENSLAQILKVESEKIQKGIHLSNSVFELNSIDDSTERIINKITNLEDQLYAKLSLICDCLDVDDYDDSDHTH